MRALFSWHRLSHASSFSENAIEKGTKRDKEVSQDRKVRILANLKVQLSGAISLEARERRMEVDARFCDERREKTWLPDGLIGRSESFAR